jgi:hypothetical protein
MFKFTEMRPHAGVQIHAARLRHIPVYPENSDSALLAGARKAGLPNALSLMAQHLDSDGFQTRLAGYEAAINGAISNIAPDHLLGILLDQSLTFATTMPALYLGNVVQYTRGVARTYGVPQNTAVLDLVEAQLPDLADDLYALMLISTRYPEYRRFCAARHRAATIIARYGAPVFAETIAPHDINLEPQAFEMLRVFYGGRILLPQGVDVMRPTSGPQPDTGPLTTRDAVRGAMLHHLEMQKASPNCAILKDAVRKSAKQTKGAKS